MLGVDSCVFLIFTTRVGLKTRLNQVKSIRYAQSLVSGLGKFWWRVIG